MSSSAPPAVSASPDGQPLAEIERFLEEAGQRARTAETRGEFLPDFLAGLGRLLGAAGVQFWELCEGDRLERRADATLSEEYRLLAEGPASLTEPLAAVRTALHAPSPMVLAPTTGTAAEGNASPFLWIASAVHSPHRPAGVVLVCRPVGGGPAALRRMADVVGTACELAGDFFGRRQVRDLLAEREFALRLEGALTRLHRCESLSEGVLEVVNEGRRVLECDRFSLLLRRGRTWRVAGASGIEAVEHRSELAARLTRFAAAALAGRETYVWQAGTPSAAAAGPAQPGFEAEIEAPLQAYVDESHARGLAVHSLSPPPPASAENVARRDEATNAGTEDAAAEPFGAFVCEWFRAPDFEGWTARANRYCAQVAPVLANLRDWERAPLAARLRRWRRGRPERALRRGGVVAAVVGTVLAALVLIPYELRVEARGVLQPTRHRDIFAPRDGTVVDLPIDTGDVVAAGAPLLALRNEDLDLEQQRVDGDLATARKQILAIETSRLENRALGNGDPNRAGQLTAELEQLRERVAGLEELRAILSQQQAELKLSSPIAGRVLTWNLRRALDRRPVRRGQRLLTLADESGPWELELWIPDHRAGYVRSVMPRQPGSDALPAVDYTLATEPGVSRSARLATLGIGAEVREAGERPTVRGEIALDHAGLADPRPGTSVAARIHCGRYPLGYVLFHEVWEAVWRAWLF